MNKIRKFLVKYLFGRYWFKLPFQKMYNNTNRGPFWFYNGYLLIGLSWLLFGQNELVIQSSIPYTLLVLYFGFPLGGLGYFSKFPVKWKELDDEQKWYYGAGATSGQLTKKIEFTSSQMSEWLELNQKFRKKYLVPKL